MIGLSVVFGRRMVHVCGGLCCRSRLVCFSPSRLVGHGRTPTQILDETKAQFEAAPRRELPGPEEIARLQQQFAKRHAQLHTAMTKLADEKCDVR